MNNSTTTIRHNGISTTTNRRLLHRNISLAFRDKGLLHVIRNNLSMSTTILRLRNRSILHILIRLKTSPRHVSKHSRRHSLRRRRASRHFRSNTRGKTLYTNPKRFISNRIFRKPILLSGEIKKQRVIDQHELPTQPS